jgi:NAD(P)-dependent dehydrogenase (short-subunit alcohol dehydrogenase family)
MKVTDVLVLGGSGFIGRHVVADLTKAGAHVRVIDLNPHPDPGVEIVLGDLAEPDVLSASLEGGFDAVVHLAAVTSVLRSLEQPELTYRTNVAATAALLEGGGTALWRRDDPAIDAGERALLDEWNMAAVLAAAAVSEEGAWLVELFADGRSADLAEIETVARTLCVHALHGGVPGERSRSRAISVAARADTFA